MVAEDNTTTKPLRPQTESEQPVLTVPPRHRWVMSDDEFACIMQSIENSLDQIDEFIERYWSFGTRTPTAATTNQ
jgi:hypothetical protein